MNMLTKQRQQIDNLDTQIVALLEQRLNVALEVARIKKVHGLPVYDATREQKLLERIALLVEQEHYVPLIQEVYNEILRTSKQLQQQNI